MPKKGELSKTARASLGNRTESTHILRHICPNCGEAIAANQMLAVRVLGKGMVYYHKEHYKLQ